MVRYEVGIVILTRREFSDRFNQEHPGLGDADSALWEPERYEPNTVPSRWFLCAVVPGLREWDWDRPGYWRWVSDHCRGQVLCYSLDGTGQGWWGFEHRDDILLWSLRWVA